MGNRVSAPEYEACWLHTHCVEGLFHGLDDKVPLVARDVIGSFAGDFDEDAFILGDHRDQLVIDGKSQTNGVKARTHVRAAGWNENPNRSGT
jgi:hypothetical protein